VLVLVLSAVNVESYVSPDEPELEILEPINGSTLQLHQGSSAIILFGLNNLDRKGRCEEFTIRLILNNLAEQHLSPCACESLEYYCLLSIALINLPVDTSNLTMAGAMIAKADVVHLRSWEVVASMTADFEVVLRADTNCECHYRRACQCHYSYSNLMRGERLDCDRSINCRLIPSSALT